MDGFNVGKHRYSVGFLGVPTIEIMKPIAEKMGYKFWTGENRAPSVTQSLGPGKRVFVKRPDGNEDLSELWEKVEKAKLKEAP